MIRQRYPDQRVITRGWNDNDGIEQTIATHRGPVALVGHSFGGCKSVELAARVGRAVEWLVLLDPVPCDDWAFRHAGKYFEVPANVQNAVCFHRPAGGWPTSYGIVNPATPSVDRMRALGHSSFGENAEVREWVMNACGVEAARRGTVAAK
jgi:pimeloyl-ACP methyl ester carboxylesterase